MVAPDFGMSKFKTRLFQRATVLNPGLRGGILLEGKPMNRFRVGRAGGS